MSTEDHGSGGTGSRWQRHLVAAASCAAFGLVVHAASGFLPVELVTIGLGIGLLGASFMLAWGADAGEAVFSAGLVLAVIALLTVLPEFVIELRFAFTQQAELVTANLTGATRLLLTGAAALPLLVSYLDRNAGAPPEEVRLDPNRRLELGILLITGVFAVQVVVRGNLTIFDGMLLLVLYVAYARRVRGTQDEEPAVVGVSAGLLSLQPRYQRLAIGTMIGGAGAVVLTVANPFADALLATGTKLGFDPYLLIQSVVPVATEAPEFVVVAVLVANHRPAQGLALFLASSVSQWTLALGALPIAFLAGGGGIALPLAGREQLEVSLTIATTLFVVGALATLRPVAADAYLVGATFVVQLLYPTPYVRFFGAFVLLTFAIDLLCSRRREIRPLVRAGIGRRSRAR